MDKETYCLCGQPYTVGQFMIECDICKEWFHGSCVDVKIYQSEDIDKYHCPKCSLTYGPSVLKMPTNDHRQDRYEVGAETRPAQAGSPAWVAALAARPPRPSRLALQLYNPQDFTEEIVKDNGFTRPVFFNSVEGLGMTMPNSATFTPRSVLRYCGANMEVQVIDVRKQSSLRMPLGDLVDYMQTPLQLRDEKVLNVLSLEISDTSMSSIVTPPAIVRKLDWAERVWPDAESRPARPAVQKYCLISAAGSYTDFHVDFGGTSVWYHALHGRKIFYLVPPTATNLALYQQWNTSLNQNERFFGDLVEWYGTVEVGAGQTLLIPTGWIHAVLTPEDSIVMGGNFLHSYAIELQLQINEIERRVDTPVVFRYPLFETMHWHAAAHLLGVLHRHNEENQDEDYIVQEHAKPAPPELPPLLVRGVRILTTALKEWHALKNSDLSKRDNVPKCINSAQLVRELSRELRKLERHRPSNGVTKDKEYKPRSPTKSQEQRLKRQLQLPPLAKPMKLTLPDPIVHLQHSAPPVYYHHSENKDFLEPKPFMESGVSGEDLSYGGYDEMYVQPPGYADRCDRKSSAGSVMRIKIGSPSSSRDELAPPAYDLPSHSHLTQLTGVGQRQQQLWTISKKGESRDERILFTNENLTVPNDALTEQQVTCVYSTRVGSDWHYSESAAPGSCPQYSTPAPHIYKCEDLQPVEASGAHETALYSTQEHPQLQQHYARELPTYSAAVATHYAPHTLSHAPYQPPAAEPKPNVAVRRSERPVRRRMSNTYSYEEGDLFIDETPPRRRKRDNKQPFRSQLPNYRQTQRLAPANGIESLIQASVLAEEPSDNTEHAAVAGMLSMGERLGGAGAAPRDAGVATPTPSSQRTFGLPHHNIAAQSSGGSGAGGGGGSRRARRPPPAPAPDSDSELDEAQLIKEVHRDEEFVYPSLEMSSDEDEEPAAVRRRHKRHNADARRDKDESWSPRARLGRLAPRSRCPARAGVRREAVRKALQAAAGAPSAPHVHHAPPPRQTVKRIAPPPKPRRPPPPPPPPPVKNVSRQKKGMKTAKQRLGKILKIHKMIY